MRTVNDPYGGYSPLVDKMIGNAYEVVKHVAMNLVYVRHVSANLEQVYTVATNIEAVLKNASVSDQIIIVAGLQEQVKELGDNAQALIDIGANLTALLHLNANVTPLLDLEAHADALVDLHSHQADYLSVAAKLPELTEIMDKVDALQTQKLVTGTAAAVSASTNIAMGTPATTVKAVSVKITGLDGTVYFPGTASFGSTLSGSNLIVTTSADAPANLVGGAIEALISYTPAA